MPRPFGQRYVDRQSHWSVTCWPGAPVASVISANALVCDRDGGDPAGPGCDDANVARMCDYYLGGNQQQRRGQPARRRWPAPTPPLPGKSWFPQTPSHPQEHVRIHHQRGRDHVLPSSAFTPASPFRSPAGARGLNLRLHAASRSHRSSPHRQPRLVLACLCSPADQVLGPAVPSGTSVLLAPPSGQRPQEDGPRRRRQASYGS